MPPFKRQAAGPLYPAVLWNRPVARSTAGRLLIVGGHRGDFSQPTALHGLTLAAGVGQATVVLPDALRSLLAGASDVVFMPSSPAGSLGRAATAEILELTSRHDGLLITGLGNNSETAMLVESLLQNYSGPLVLAGNSLDILAHQLKTLVKRPNLVLLATWPQLFKLAGALGQAIALDRSDLAGKLAIMQSIQAHGECSYLVIGPELIATSGPEPTITAAPGATTNLAATIATAATFWVQNPGQPLAALTTATFVLNQALPNHELSTAQAAKALRTTIDQF